MSELEWNVLPNPEEWRTMQRRLLVRGRLLREAMDRLSGTELLKEIREELKDE